ncbi:MFS transporter [Vibrio olivae]|uniref:MFS transporter n=1 Tax=Vibrio olivae TaxID=1243002 RepID=A0ABV5HJT0_9VIBR
MKPTYSKVDGDVNKMHVLAIVLASYFVILLDTSIVITGLPEIRLAFGLTTTELSWVQNAYTLSFGGFMMLGARAGDLVGRKRMFMIGLTLFTLTSLVIGLAPNATTMFIARAVQGMGAAILAPSTLALLSIYFSEGEERTKALSYYAPTAGVGASLGLVAGGVFAGWLTWRVGFLVNVPVGVVLMFAGQKVLKESDTHTGSFDLIGALTSTVGMTLLVFGIVESASLGWGNVITQASLLIAVILLTVFFVHEAKAEQPILPLRLFKSRERVGAYLARMLFLGSMVSFFFFSTQFMQGVLGFTPVEAGLGFLPFTIPTFFASRMVPRFTKRIGNQGVMYIAFVFLLVGLIGLSMVTAQSSYLYGLAIPMLIIGFGNGAALGPLTIAGVAGVGKEDTGAASGLVNVAHQLGGSLGLSILVVVFASASTPNLDGELLLAHQISAAYHGSVWMIVGAIAIMLLLNFIPSLLVKYGLLMKSVQQP